jgi:predicted SAM-dependent methyltransferase
VSFNNFIKRFIKKPSIRVRLRNVQSAVTALVSDLSKEWGHGSDLEKFCRGKTGVMLHIGCGPIVLPNWVNIDFSPGDGTFYFNLLNPLPLQSGSVTRIHAEHFLEHLDYDDAVHFLSECCRVLAAGASMRIIVPDAEKYMRAYAADDKNFFECLKELGGASKPLPTKAAICNQMFRMNGDHRFAWDFDTLAYASRAAGFKAINKSVHNDPKIPNAIDGQDWWRPVESLYAELEK